MIPALQRRRSAATLAACLAGLAVAIVVITRAEDTPEPRAEATAEPQPDPTSTASSTANPSTSASANANASANVRANENENEHEHEHADEEEATVGGEHRDPVHADKSRKNPDGTPIDRPVPLGTLDKDSIREAMRTVKPLLKACFEEALRHDPSVAGRVRVEFEIEAADDERGVVKRGSVVESETRSPFFEACVLQKVAGVEMPVPQGGGVVKVTYPFQFDPGGGFGGEAPPDGTETESP